MILFSICNWRKALDGDLIVRLWTTTVGPGRPPFSTTLLASFSSSSFFLSSSSPGLPSPPAGSGSSLAAACWDILQWTTQYYICIFRNELGHSTFNWNVFYIHSKKLKCIFMMWIFFASWIFLCRNSFVTWAKYVKNHKILFCNTCQSF